MLHSWAGALTVLVPGSFQKDSEQKLCWLLLEVYADLTAAIASLEACRIEWVSCWRKEVCGELCSKRAGSCRP